MGQRVPTDASRDVQSSIQDLWDANDKLQKRLDDLESQQAASPQDIKKVQDAVDALGVKPTQLDFNDVARGSGPAHSIGYVPDPGEVTGTDRVLTEEMKWRLPMGGLIRPVTNVGMLDHQLPGDILSVLGSLALTGSVGAYKAYLAGLEVMSGTGFINLVQRAPDLMPLLLRCYGSGSGGLQPNQTSGTLTGWWKADAGCYHDAGVTPCNNGDTVAQWNDQSGNSRYATYVSAGPVYQTNIKNGLPAIKYNGQSDPRALARGSVAGSIYTVSTGTALAVWYINAGIYGSPFALARASDGGTVVCIDWATNATRAVNYDGAFEIQSQSGSTGTWYISTHMHLSGNIYQGRNDTRTASLQSVASGNSSGLDGNLQFGYQGGGYLDGYIAEVATYNTALSENDRMGVEAYLATKWGITIPYQGASARSNVDLLRIEDANGTAVFRIDYLGNLYSFTNKMNVP